MKTVTTVSSILTLAWLLSALCFPEFIMMKRKIVVHFIVLTFAIMFIFWGGMAICAQFGITLDEYPLLYLPFVIGNWSPAIASFIILKKSNKVSGMKEWLKNVFAVKASVYHYLFVAALLVILTVSLIVPAGLKQIDPLYMFIVWTLGSLVTGAGMEEAGWRYVLYPELNKKFSYIRSCLVIAPIHIVWHVPLWLALESGPLGVTSFWSAIFIFGVTFTIGAIHKISKGNVFLCLLFHCMVNAAPMTVMPYQTIPGVVITSIIMIVISIAAVLLINHKQQRVTSTL